LLAAGIRVIAVDPYYFGESKFPKRDYLQALQLAAVGDRPLGLQVSQITTIARWAQSTFGGPPATLVSIGPRSSVIALAATAIDEKAIGEVELHGAMGSLKEIIEKDQTVEASPELFCFGLLEAFDLKEIAALVAPRRLRLVEACDRAKSEFSRMREWYATLGTDFDPIK
jgi:hypothetical protein